ncbi:hypothetical protein [Paenibacillus xylanexedens]|uniref:hypothetical protein n=1 Tax=Paenibacillus xylanexedens TaxID=528191 RepID=UPI0011A63159|nr:hypothetical protein [Paenibacillus xylanexedens]
MSEIKPDVRDSAAFGFTYTNIPGTYRCVKARFRDAEVGGFYSREFIDALSEKFDVVVAEPRQLAEVLPFVPRPSPESIAQAAVIALLERYTDLARAGEVTGVIIAAKTKDDVITGELMAEYMNVNTRERTLLIEELREVSSYDYDV